MASALALTGSTTSARVSNCDINKGSVDHIAVGAITVLDTDLTDNLNSWYGAAPVITDAGTRTLLPTIRASVPYAATLTTGVESGGAFAVPGASLTQKVDVWYSAGSQGVAIDGWVSSAGVVNYRLKNNLGGTVNLSGGSIMVKITS